MNCRRLLPLLALAAAGGTLAEHRHGSEPDTQDHDALWAVRMESASGQRWTGQLEVRDFAGTWNVTPSQGAPDPACDGRPTPITVQASHAEDLDLTVWGDAVAPRCPNLTLALKRRADGRLEATLADGRRVELARQSAK
jgi:hypothetical protein